MTSAPAGPPWTGRERAAAAALGVLLALVPFEPREPLFRAAGLRFTLLEVAAAGVLLVLAGLYGRSLAARGVRGALTPPVLALLALAVTSLVSAACAPEYRGPAAVFSLRLGAAALFALVVAALPRRVQESGLLSLAVAGSAGAALAVAEAAGLRALDPFLDLFRERAFGVGDARRATAGTAGPTLGAAFIAAGLVAGLACRAGRARALVSGALAVGLGFGLVATYSRGGLVAAAAGLAALAWAQPSGSAARRRASAALAALIVTAGVFLASPAFRPRLAPEWRWRGLSARYALVGPAPRFAPGADARVRLRVTNDGVDWPVDDTFALAVGWYHPEDGQARSWAVVPLGGRVAAGQSAELEVGVRAPDRPGHYALVLNVTSASTGYLSLAGVEPGFVPVTVGQPPGPTDLEPPSRRGRRDRWEMWRIALAMWRDRPVTGVGPDNFRRLDARYGRWMARGNVPLGAHNAFLEAAATTGTLGLLALLAVFGTAARAALRARGRTDEAARPPAVLALLTVLAVQGLVDSLLGFTGVYLLLAFVVGMAGALDVSRRAPRDTGPPPGAAAR